MLASPPCVADSSCKALRHSHTLFISFTPAPSPSLPPSEARLLLLLLWLVIPKCAALHSQGPAATDSARLSPSSSSSHGLLAVCRCAVWHGHLRGPLHPLPGAALQRIRRLFLLRGRSGCRQEAPEQRHGGGVEGPA